MMPWLPIYENGHKVLKWHVTSHRKLVIELEKNLAPASNGDVVWVSVASREHSVGVRYLCSLSSKCMALWMPSQYSADRSISEIWACLIQGGLRKSSIGYGSLGDWIINTDNHKLLSISSSSESTNIIPSSLTLLTFNNKLILTYNRSHKNVIMKFLAKYNNPLSHWRRLSLHSRIANRLHI